MEADSTQRGVADSGGGDTWRQGWTDVLFVFSLLCAAAANLLAPMLFQVLAQPNLIPASPRARSSPGFTLIMSLAHRADILMVAVAGVAVLVALAYVARRKGGPEASARFTVWTFLVGVGSAPLIWALLLLGS